MSTNLEEKNDLVSIVIPVYNVYKYLGKCIESLRAQTYSMIEILLVDDGSTDDSGIVCDIYEEIDLRIRVIHKENGGLSDARNEGIRLAKGKYITFIDSVDYVLPNYIMHLLELIQIEGTDIAVTCVTKFYESSTIREELFECSNKKIFTSEEALTDMLYKKNIPIYVNAKMYKAKLFEQILFPLGELFEDLSTMYLLFHLSGQIVFNPIKDYCYLQRDNRIVNSSFRSEKMNQIAITEKIIEFMQQKYPKSIGAAISKCFIVTVNLYRTIPKKKEYIEYRVCSKAVIKKYRKEVLMDRKNKPFTRIIALCSLLSIEGIVCVAKIK